MSSIPMTNVTIRYEADEYRSVGAREDLDPRDIAWTALDRLEDDNQHTSREYRRRPISVTVHHRAYTVEDINAWHSEQAARAAEEAARVRTERLAAEQEAAERAARTTRPPKVYQVTARAGRLLRQN